MEEQQQLFIAAAFIKFIAISALILSVLPRRWGFRMRPVERRMMFSVFLFAMFMAYWTFKMAEVT